MFIKIIGNTKKQTKQNNKRAARGESALSPSDPPIEDCADFRSFSGRASVRMAIRHPYSQMVRLPGTHPDPTKHEDLAECPKDHDSSPRQHHRKQNTKTHLPIGGLGLSTSLTTTPSRTKRAASLTRAGPRVSAKSLSRRRLKRTTALATSRRGASAAAA